MLNPGIFKQPIQIWGSPNIDIFATRLNKQLLTYSSWKPYPGFKFTIAFSVSWSGLFCYIFPPFSLQGRVEKKLRRDHAEGLVIAPM